MPTFTSLIKVSYYNLSLYLGLVVFFTCALLPTNSLSSTMTHACTLPYNTDIQPQSAKIVAKSFAYIQAISQAEAKFKNNMAINIGLKNTDFRKAVAAELYSVKEHYEPQTFSSPMGDIHVTVEINLTNKYKDKDVAKLVSSHDILEMRLELINLLDKYAHRGQKLILMLAGIQKDNQNNSLYASKTELFSITSALQALWLYDEALKHFQETWDEPELIQAKLQEAIRLAPGIAALWTALAEVQLQLDQPHTAIQNLDHALALDQERARAFYIRGLGHLRLQQPTLAKADLDTALAYKPKVASWLNARGAISLVLEDYIPMCEDFEQACALGNCEGLIHARKRDLCLQ